MSYYPVLDAPGCPGSTTLFNFAPNNWEVRSPAERHVHVTWTEGGRWKSEHIGSLAHGASRRIVRADLPDAVPQTALPFLSLSTAPLPADSAQLPDLDRNMVTGAPAWRATIGLSGAGTSTSYQGEVDPFPPKGTLLTFCPFLQYGNEIENYLLLINLEKSAVARTALVEIFDSETKELKGEFEVANNSATSIRLDGLGFGPTDLPLIICRGMAAVPLYFSKTSDCAFLSLEHTHPPASFVIHGNRWEVQKNLKNQWFAKVAR